MNIIEALKQWIAGEELAELEKLKASSKFMRNRIDYLENKTEGYEVEIVALESENGQLEMLLEEFENNLWILPEELTTEVPPHTYIYKGSRLIPTINKQYVSLNQNEYFHPNKKLDPLIDRYNIDEIDDDFEIFNRSLKAVQESFSYTYDSNQYGTNEHFSLSFEVAVTGMDDCESLALAVIDTYLRAGGNPNKIFWCAGHYHSGSESYGHGWVGFRDDDGIWYIGEATRSSYSAPIEWANLKNKYVPDWGMSNKEGSFFFKDWDAIWT